MKIVIISFTFPPQVGIGGRRWVKFAKYFHHLGVDFKVLTAKPIQTGSEWLKDSDLFSERIICTDTYYPDVLRVKPRTIVQKLKYRAWVFWLKLSYSGNYYDHSIFWKKSLLTEVESLYLNGYSTIIATAGPFRYLADLVALKEKYGSGLKLIADFRDPWTNNKTSFGYSELQSKRLRTEQIAERLIVNKFDLIVSVAEDMTRYFMSLHASLDVQDKFITIPNGFDPNEITVIHNKMVSSKFRFMFVGTLYRKTIDSIKVLARAIHLMKPSNIEFHFYGDRSEEANLQLSGIDCVFLHPKVSLSESHELISNASVVMLFLTDDLTYSFSTKFCEYIACKKPVWVVSEYGATSDFVLKNKIGFHSLPTLISIGEFLKEIDNSFESKLMEIDYENFDSSAFDIRILTLRYIELLESL